MPGETEIGFGVRSFKNFGGRYHCVNQFPIMIQGAKYWSPQRKELVLVSATFLVFKHFMVGTR